MVKYRWDYKWLNLAHTKGTKMTNSTKMAKGTKKG